MLRFWHVSGVQSDAKLFPADAKLRPQGRIQAKPGGGVTPPRILENKKGPSRKRRGCVRFRREASEKFSDYKKCLLAKDGQRFGEG